MAKGFDPVVTKDGPEIAIGRALPMRPGRDGLAVTTGITLKLALDAAATLAADGLELAILHVPTMKPIDRPAVVAAMTPVPVIVTIEEHSIIGGLGSAVAEIIAEEGFNPAKRFKRIGIPDVFPDSYGSQASLMARYGITAEAVASAIRDAQATVRI
jgi:transketolase